MDVSTTRLRERVRLIRHECPSTDFTDRVEPPSGQWTGPAVSAEVDYYSRAAKTVLTPVLVGGFDGGVVESVARSHRCRW